MEINADFYLVKIYGSEVGRGQLYVNRLLATNVPRSQPEFDMVEGIEVREPAFGLPAKWITVQDRAKAERLGFAVYDPPSVMGIHLMELIKDNAASLLTRQDVQEMLNALKESSPVLVEEALKPSNKGVSSISEIHKILQSLLREKVKIRNMIPILETIADYKAVMHFDALSEKIREVLGRQIVSNPAVSHNKTIRALMVDPKWEQILFDSLKEGPQGYVAHISDEMRKEFVYSTGTALQQKLSEGVHPVVMCSKGIRLLVRDMLVAASFGSTPVVAHSEVPSDFIVETLGFIAKS